MLAPSTARYDLRLKFELYRQIPTFIHYILLHQDSIFAVHYSKCPDGSWLMRECRGEDARIPLPEIDCELHLGSVYDGAMSDPG